jgi:hypothetical protein
MLLHQANNSSIEYDSFTWSAVGVTVPVLSYKVPGKNHFYLKVLWEKKSKILLWDQIAHLSFRVN